MPESEAPNMIDVSIYPVGAELTIPMLPRNEKIKTAGRTVIRIFQSGIEPVVDCLRTEEGETIGPKMLLLGSVATAISLEQLVNDPEGLIVSGKIVGNHRLVLGVIGTRTPNIVAGVIDPELDFSIRQRRI